MKRILFSFLTTLYVFNMNAQSIAINTDKSAPNASAILDIKSTNKGLLIPRMTTAQRTAIGNPAKGLMVFDITTNSGWFYNGTAWSPLAGSASANYWDVNSGGDIYNNTAGFIGIGTATPAYKFSVQTQTNQVGLSHTDGTVTLASYIGVFNGGLGGWLGTRSNHPLYFFTNNSVQQMTIMPSGNVGIGTINPTNKLQIGNNPGFSGYDIGIGNGTQGMVFQQNNGFSNWQSNTNITLLPTNATGNVGINSVSPTNHLQIGNNPGFSGYDLAIGNGAQGMVFEQNNGFSNWQSSTNITLLPTNATGNVGINTTTPRFPLEVAGYVVKYTSYYDYFNTTAYNNGIRRCAPCDATVSVFASNAVYASEFDVFSDARIKNIIGTSNGSKDLKTIDALQIKNYTMKDKVKYGEKPYKKVIAQEVEKVYPRVISKHTDFIPNVYQVTNKITKTANGYLLTFPANHKIDSDAKKLQLIFAESGMQQFDIVVIPSATEVIINATDMRGDKVFVYGEEVNDFRTVDYEGLTTLNISATQELSRQVKKQQEEINHQNKKIAQLMEMAKLSAKKSLITRQLD